MINDDLVQFFLDQMAYIFTWLRSNYLVDAGGFHLTYFQFYIGLSLASFLIFLYFGGNADE